MKNFENTKEKLFHLMESVDPTFKQKKSLNENDEFNNNEPEEWVLFVDDPQDVEQVKRTGKTPEGYYERKDNMDGTYSYYYHGVNEPEDTPFTYFENGFNVDPNSYLPDKNAFKVVD